MNSEERESHRDQAASDAIEDGSWDSSDPQRPELSIPLHGLAEQSTVELSDRQSPLMAKLIEPEGTETPIRTGSPFAVDPPEAFILATSRPVEVLMDVGPIRYTAMGAVAAAGMLLAFAGVAAWWFPVGGTMIAALGCVLSIFGLYSPYRYTSVVLLTCHLALFITSYARSLS